MSRFDFRNLIIFENQNYLIINKPAGLTTLADRNNSQNILALARKLDPHLQTCHRLDKETSGVMVLARNPEAYRFLAMQFEDRTVDKIYYAVVDGLHNFQDKVIDVPLMSNRSGVTKVSMRHGKESKTIVTTLQTFRWHSLLECKPVTGRMHQIRAHLAHLGAPVVGDKHYRGKTLYLSSVKKNYRPKKYQLELPLIKRPPLHAFRINFENTDGQQIIQEAPYPKDFAVLLKQLSMHL